jgi:hypothetical protein
VRVFVWRRRELGWDGVERHALMHAVSPEIHGVDKVRFRIAKNSVWVRHRLAKGVWPNALVKRCARHGRDGAIDGVERQHGDATFPVARRQNKPTVAIKANARVATPRRGRCAHEREPSILADFVRRNKALAFLGPHVSAQLVASHQPLSRRVHLKPRWALLQGGGNKHMNSEGVCDSIRVRMLCCHDLDLAEERPSE